MHEHAIVCSDKTSVLEPSQNVLEYCSPCRWYAYNTVISWLHRNLSKRLSSGILCICSFWWNNRHFQWKILDESCEGILECSSCTLTKIFVNWELTFDNIEQYLETARTHPIGRTKINSMNSLP